MRSPLDGRSQDYRDGYVAGMADALEAVEHPRAAESGASVLARRFAGRTDFGAGAWIEVAMTAVSSGVASARSALAHRLNPDEDG